MRAPSLLPRTGRAPHPRGAAAAAAPATPPLPPPPPLLLLLLLLLASSLRPACGARLYHGWASPLAWCNTTTYDTVTPTGLGGVFPHLADDWLACAAWKLAATVCLTRPAAYDDSLAPSDAGGGGGGGEPTNWACPSSGGFTDPLFGTYCAVSDQFVCSTNLANFCNAGAGMGPLTLRDCGGEEASQRARLRRPHRKAPAGAAAAPAAGR